MKFFIVGTAKTGTWLLTRLFHGFEDFAYIDTADERCLYDLLVYPEPPGGKHVLMKRAWAELFSNHDVGGKHAAQRRAVVAAGIRLIYMEREREGVIASQIKAWERGAKPENADAILAAAEARYDVCVEQVGEYGDLLTCRVQYERLLAEPDKVQAEVAESLGLEIKHPWSEYPSFVPDDALSQTTGGNYALRPLGAAYEDSPPA